LTKIETGVIKNPSIQTVLKLAKGLNCSLDQLVTQKGGML
jgi:transcriptional regulator with XRE-family HTH domain